MWGQVDPKAEYLYGHSPYSAMMNSPIVYNDPDGDIAPLVWAAIAVGGGALNVWNNWDHIPNGGGLGAGLKAFGVGATAAVVGTIAAPTAAVGASFGATVGSFATAGAVGGGVGGAIEGFGNSAFFGDGDFFDHLGQGALHGAIGAAGGAVLGGLTGAGAWAFGPGGGIIPAKLKIGQLGDNVPITAPDELPGSLGKQIGSIDEGLTFDGDGFTVRAHRSGTFNISDWNGYPQGLSKPSGPFRLLQGQEYRDAVKLKKSANAAYRKAHSVGSGVEVHEIHPVKFGGSPTDPLNKVVLPKGFHRGKVTPWWNRLQRTIQKKP